MTKVNVSWLLLLALSMLIMLRGTGVISCSWAWVLAPIWVPYSLVAFFAVLAGMLHATARAIETFKGPWE